MSPTVNPSRNDDLASPHVLTTFQLLNQDVKWSLEKSIYSLNNSGVFYTPTLAAWQLVVDLATNLWQLL